MGELRDKLSVVLKFGFIGVLTVGIDALCYLLLVLAGLQIDIAKGVSFAIGAIFAYLANWRFTFGARRGRFSEAAFVAVYLLAFGINVSLNAYIRSWIDVEWLALPAAFLAATGISAAWNFIGMSLFVFRRQSNDDAPPASKVDTI